MFHITRGLLTAAFLFPWLDSGQRRRAITTWSGQLLALLAVRLHVHGRLSPAIERPLMLVANHVSWLDIFAINAILAVRFVAKSEIRSWPLIGWLCERAGTLFIRQARRADTLRVNDAVTAALHAGDVFAVFPESTTTDGSRVLKFHSSLLQPAVAARATVQPVAIRFEREDGTLCTEVSYEGERSLWDTVRAITSQPVIDAHLTFLPPLDSADVHRRELAQRARDAIVLKLFP